MHIDVTQPLPHQTMTFDKSHNFLMFRMDGLGKRVQAREDRVPNAAEWFGGNS